MQTRLTPLKVKYHSEAYNEVRGNQQWIRISDGCPMDCPFCYCPKELKYYGIPKIIRNQVSIIDFNILAQPKIHWILEQLAEQRVNGKKVYYHLKGGLDKNYINEEIAVLIKKARIKKIYLAWNWEYKKEFRKLYDAVKNLVKAGYKKKEINVYIICNWRIPYSECIKKLDVLKIWGVDVFDCYYDNQTFPNVIPLYWTFKELKYFKRKCRKHYHLIKYDGYDPELNYKEEW